MCSFSYHMRKPLKYEAYTKQYFPTSAFVSVADDCYNGIKMAKLVKLLFHCQKRDKDVWWFNKD